MLKSQGLRPGRRMAAGSSVPDGVVHAYDPEAGVIACGENPDTLIRWDTHSWARGYYDRCRSCSEEVPAPSLDEGQRGQPS